MAEGLIKNWRHWPRPVQLSAAVIGCAVGLALVYTLLTGTPKPVLPSNKLFEPVNVEQTLSSSRPELSGSDFIVRPVFALNRKPPVQPDARPDQIVAAAETDVSTEVAGTISGVNLLGIFGSGEVAGIIIRLDTGERERLVVGESVSGWTLQSVTPRGAQFQSNTGSLANLQMVYSVREMDLMSEASSAPASSVMSDGSTSSAKALPQSKVGSDGEEAPSQAPSFGNFYGGPPSRDTENSRGEQ